jgi:hypothetical protein
VGIRRLKTFKEASELAKSLSSAHKEELSVKREGSEFIVDIPDWMDDEAMSARLEQCDYFDDDYNDNDPVSNSELIQEINDDADAFARSDESGWIYEDT